MKMIRFETPSEIQHSTDWAIPAHGERTFVGAPDVYLKPYLARAFTREPTSGKVIQIPIKRLLISDSTMSQQEFEEIAVVDERVVDCRLLSPLEAIRALVTNPYGSSINVRPVLAGKMTIDAPTRGPKLVEEDYVMALMPQGVAEKRFRFELKPGESISLMKSPPCDCVVKRVTMRSNSKLDVVIFRMRAANVDMTNCGDLPVEFFHDGADVRSNPLTPCNRIGIEAKNVGSESRWVEVDMEIMPLRSQQSLQAEN